MSCGEKWKPVVLMIAVNFCFAIVNILFKMVLNQGTNQMVIVTYRLFISTIFMTPIACWSERKSRPKISASTLCYTFIGALFGLTLTQYLFILGLQYTSATFSCAFLNTVPVNTFMLSVLFGLEKVKMSGTAGRAKVLGALVCMSGAIFLTLYKGIPLNHPHSGSTGNSGDAVTSDKKTQNSVIGSVFLLAGCFSWSSWFLIQAKIGKAFPYQYSSTALLAFFGAVQTTVLGLITQRNASAWILKGKLEIITVIFAGMVGSGLSYVVMAWCVKKKGPVFSSAFTPFTQIFAAMFDFSFLHEQLYLGSVLGSLLVVFGLYILLWGKNRDAAEESSEVVIKPAQQESKEGENYDPESQLTVTTNSRST